MRGAVVKWVKWQIKNVKLGRISIRKDGPLAPGIPGERGPAVWLFQPVYFCLFYLNYHGPSQAGIFPS